MLIDVTSFTSGPRQIENAAATLKSANQIAVTERINGYIELLQPEFLRKVAGKQLGQSIDDYCRVEHRQQGEEPMEQNENQQVELAEPDERMESLIKLLKEPFADYVFFYMLRDMNVQPTITGLVQLKCANSYVSPLEKGVQTWNHMVDGLSLFLEEVTVEGVTIESEMLTYINKFNL